MKKIIALAVAGAFVAPAFAADVTVGGSATYNYVTDDRATLDDKVEGDDVAINFGATQELDNGMTVTATFNLVDDTTGGLDNQGTNLKVSGAFGTLNIGDVSGAMDAVGDWTDQSPIFGGYRNDGDDMALNYTLPSIIPGVKINASMSPNGANFAGDDPFTTEGEGGTALSLEYTNGAVAVYYGEETYDEAATQEASTSSYGIKYSAGPMYFAVEAGSADNMDQSASLGVAHATAISNKSLDFMGIAGTYSMGATKIGFEKQEVEEKAAAGNTKRVDETTLFVSQDLGNGVSVYAATSSDDGGPADTSVERQAIGIKFAF